MMSRPGRGRLPPPLDAGRGARVPRQALQQRRAHRVDPPGLQPRAREAQPDGRVAGRRPRRTAARRSDGPRGEPGMVVAVFSPKGGVGRTTVAVNLAVAAATELGKKVVARRRLVPVRRRRRAAQPQPQEQVDRRPRPRARAGRTRSSRSTRSSSTTRPASASCSRRRRPRWPSSSRRPASSGSSRRCALTHDLVVVDCTAFFNDTTLAILDIGRHDPDDAQPRDHEHQEHAPLPRGRRPARLRAAARSGSSSTAPTRRSASASRTSSTRSAARSTTPSSATGGAWSTRSTGAYRSSCSNREAQVSQDILRLARSVVGERAQVAAGTEDAGKAAQKKSLFAWR